MTDRQRFFRQATYPSTRYAFTGDMLIEGGEVIADIDNDGANVVVGALDKAHCVWTAH